MINRRCKILVVDKKDKYSILFNGFRKHKYTISQKETLILLPEIEMMTFNLFFVVIYEFKDLIDLLRIHDREISVIIASENLRILKKLKQINCLFLVNLSGEVNITTSFHNCFQQVLDSKI